jgi:hypothetical protein
VAFRHCALSGVAHGGWLRRECANERATSVAATALSAEPAALLSAADDFMKTTFGYQPSAGTNAGLHDLMKAGPVPWTLVRRNMLGDDSAAL